jgi:hypothetical protein
MALNLTSVAENASLFIVSRALAERMLVLVGVAFEYDVKGAVESGQLGAAVYSARIGLRFGIDVFLVLRGVECVRRPDVTMAVERLAKYDEALYSRAWELECRNPETAQDVSAYVNDCQAFVENALNLGSVPAYRAAFHPAATVAHRQRLKELAEALSHLGIGGVLRLEMDALVDNLRRVQQTTDQLLARQESAPALESPGLERSRPPARSSHAATPRHARITDCAISRKT